MQDNDNSLPCCVSTHIEALIALMGEVLVFLLGFGFSSLAYKLLLSYNEMKVEFTLKITLLLNMSTFWIIYVLGWVINYYCFRLNITHNTTEIMNPEGIVLIQVIWLSFIVLQFVFVQVNATKRAYYILINTKYPLTIKSMLISVWFTIISTSLFFVSILFYYSPYIENYQYLRDYVVIILPVGMVFAVFCHINMSYKFVKTLFLMIYDSKTLYHQSFKYESGFSDCKDSKSTDQTIPTKLTPSITLFSDSQGHSIQNLNESNTTTFLGQTPEYISATARTPKVNIVIPVGINLSIMKNISKLITISLVACILIGIPLICCILAVIFKEYNNVMTIITGHILTMVSMFSIFYMYLHFPFSDKIYYNKLICCIKCDNKITEKISKMVEKQIIKNGNIRPLLLENSSLNT